MARKGARDLEEESSGRQASRKEIRKRRSRTRVDLGEPVRSVSEAASSFCGGLAEAVSDAFGALGDELSSDNVTRRGLSTSFMNGVAAGNARFFGGMARLSEDVYEDLRNPERDVTETAARSIDYELLARLVAEQIRKSPLREEEAGT
jgi:hypothetical protein